MSTTNSNVSFQQEVEAIRRDMGSLKENDPNLSDAKIARSAGISPSALSQLLADRYPSITYQFLDKVQGGLRRIRAEQMDNNLMPFIETSVYRLIQATCEEALQYRKSDSIGLICGHVGVGKSTGLARYAKINSNTVYMKGSDISTKSDALYDLASKLGVPQEERLTIAARRRKIVNALASRECLVVLDEANKCPNQVLEVVRCIADETKVGLVFAGREFLYHRLASNDGMLAELGSRVMTWNPIITHITDEDVSLIVDGSFTSMIDENKSMMLQCSENNGRVLEHLCSKVNNWIFNNSMDELEPDTIRKIYQNFIKPRSAQWRNKGQVN